MIDERKMRRKPGKRIEKAINMRTSEIIIQDYQKTTIMRKLFVIFVLMLGCMSINAQSDNARKAALKCANDIVCDLAHGKIQKFHWLTVKEVPQLFHPQSERALQGWKKAFSNYDDILLELREVKKEGTALGVNWNDLKVTDVRYSGSYDDEFGAEEMKGYIFIKSNGKLFHIFFKRGFLLNGEWRSIELRSIGVGNPDY